MKNKKENYFNNGLIEMFQYDKFVYMKSLLDEESLKQVVINAKKELPKLTIEISNYIDKIKEDFKEINPLLLLCMIADRETMSNFNINSESEMTEDSVFLGHCLIYLQSFACSYSGKYKLDINESDNEHEKYERIINNSIEMLKIYCQFYIGIKYLSQNDNPNKRDDLCLRMYLEMMNFVTGNRYQCFQKQYFSILLIQQNDLIFGKYKITSEQVINGLEKYNKFLSSGLNDAIELIGKSWNNYQEIDFKNKNAFEKFKEKINNDEEIQKAFDISLGFGKYNFGAITNFPELLLSDLSYEIGKETTFSKEDKPFWPSKQLPINKRPLIKYDNNYYCFWSRTFFDKFYRVLYKSLTYDDSNAKEIWNINQKLASENNIIQLLVDKFDFTKHYINNYYHNDNNLRKERYENDGIIFYENKLLIIEVKAGALSSDTISENFESFENNFKEIFNKGITQGERLINFLSKYDMNIYDENNNLKICIPKVQQNNIYVLNVTIDDMNEITSSFEKTKYATYSKTHNCISISLSDLLVYCDYFDDKISLFHFLSKRCKSINSESIKLNDELDHLGLYISHNDYTMYSESLETKNISWTGYRSKIDEYYCKKYNDNNLIKPKQILPIKIQEIIDFLNINSKLYDNSVDIACDLLDFSSETKETLNNIITEKLVSKELTPKVLFLKGNKVNYSFIIQTENQETLSEQIIDNHVFATILAAKEKERNLYILKYIKNNITEIKYKHFNINNLTPKQIKECEQIKKTILEQRLTKINKKIGRNDLCYCGSGKKYKYCCLNKDNRTSI